MGLFSFLTTFFTCLYVYSGIPCDLTLNYSDYGNQRFLLPPKLVLFRHESILFFQEHGSTIRLLSLGDMSSYRL